MTSVRSLSNLHCASCREQTLHIAGKCQRCGTVNESSGQAPIPRPYGYSTMKATQYNAGAEQAAARRRARAARHRQQLSMRGQT